MTQPCYMVTPKGGGVTSPEPFRWRPFVPCSLFVRNFQPVTPLFLPRWRGGDK